MDEELFTKGLAKRKATLGADYVQNAIDNADDFSLPFQEAMTEWCWGFGWGDEVIDVKTRSMLFSSNLLYLLKYFIKRSKRISNSSKTADSP